MNPMYLFRGETPVAEFAEAMPPIVRWGMKTPAGRGFLKRYEFEEGYFREKALALPPRALDAADAAGRDQPVRHDGAAMADGFELVAMGRAVLREPDLVNRLQLGPARGGICTHCNRCMPTIYSGTRCVEWTPEETIPVA